MKAVCKPFSTVMSLLMCNLGDEQVRKGCGLCQVDKESAVLDGLMST